jgi:intracellular multiplication protein IcmE
VADENANKFDPEAQKKAAEKLKEIRSHNMRTVFGTGAGRIAVGCVSAGFIVMLFYGVYTMMSGPKTAQRASPGDAMLGVTGRNGDPVAANQAEANARAQQDNTEAARAAAAGKPYMAPPVLVASNAQGDPQMGGADAMAPASPPAPTSASGQQGYGQYAQQQQPAQNGVTQIAQHVAQQLTWPGGYRGVAAAIGASEVTPQVLAIARGADPTQANHAAAYQVAYYPVAQAEDARQRTSTQQMGQMGVPGLNLGGNPESAAAASSVAPTAQKHAIPGLTAGVASYCKFFFGINSDLPRKDAVAKCYGGVADGGVFVGKAEPSAEGVGDPGFNVTFDHLTLPGHDTLQVLAVGVDVATMEENVADSVNSHGVVKFSELALAGLLKGIGSVAGQVQSNTSTQTVGNVSTTTFATLKPDVWQIAGGAAGGVGNGIGQYIQQKSDALKTTIKVFPGKDIGVILLQDVTE